MAGEGKGWISIYRSIQDHWLWQEKPFSKGQAWLDLLLSANHQDKKTLLGNELITIKRGSFITSQKKLMERWGWGSEKTRTFLKLLDSDGMIKFQPDKKKTTIVILNYNVYQSQNAFSLDNSMDSKEVQNANRMQTECKQNDSRTSAETNNNDNNVNNVNNDNNVYERDELSHSALELCKYYSNLKPGQNITQHIDTLKIWIDMYGIEWTKEVLQMCVSSKGMFIKPWIDKVLKDWKANGKPEPKTQEPKQYGKTSTFNDYTQRQYDYDDLEKKLLGWDKE